MNVQVSEKRLYWIDNIRALAMISMVIYHAMWDLVYLYGVRVPWYHGKAAFYWQQSICWTFILLAGFCSKMSRNLIRHGVIVSIWGIVVMVVTQVLMPGNAIWFGVLTLIGSCTLLMAFLKRYMAKIPPTLGFFVAFGLFVFTYHVGRGYIGFLGTRLLEVPDAFYRNLFTAYLGFPPVRFYSTDYFPLIPWMFLYFSGAFLHGLWAKYRPEVMEKNSNRIAGLTYLGKYALVVYVLHQPIIYGVLEVWFKYIKK